MTISYNSARALYRRLFTFIKPFWPILALGLVANILYAGIDAGFTYMMRPFLDKGLIEIDHGFVKTIPVIILVGVTMRGLVSAFAGYCMTWVARSVVNVLRQRVFAHIVNLPADYYDESPSGQLLSKILYDVEQVSHVSANALTDLVQNIFLVIGLLTVMMMISWQLSLMFLLTVPLIGAVVNYTNKRVRRISHRVQAAMGDVTSTASEAIEGYKEVKLFGGIAHETAKFNQATEHARKQDMKVAVSRAINVSGVQIIIAMGIGGIIFAAIMLSSVITVTAGSFVAIIAAMLQLIRPMKVLTSLNSVLQRGLAGAESIFRLLDEPYEKEGEAVFPARIQGKLAFEHVNFAYRDGPTVLTDVSFAIAPGETVALVGHSGSGKTSIASLIPRFYRVNDGAIMIDDVPINDLSLESLRAQIAYVSQHVTLFDDTLLNNIAYGAFDAPREAVIAAAKHAYADDFIQKLPEGYDTRVGENGVLLSGGQRQRVAIARAILKDAPILILDEATSALDTTSERYIQQALESIMKNRTTLVIAHRLSTIQNADKILVMHEGKLVEFGTHAALLEKKGHYKRLYEAQYINQEVAEVVEA